MDPVRSGVTSWNSLVRTPFCSVSYFECISCRAIRHNINPNPWVSSNRWIPLREKSWSPRFDHSHKIRKLICINSLFRWVEILLSQFSARDEVDFKWCFEFVRVRVSDFPVSSCHRHHVLVCFRVNLVYGQYNIGQYGIKVYDLIRFKLNLIHNRLTMQ